MKKEGQKKLSLDKIKIALLNNSRAIIGGSFPTATEIPPPDFTKTCDDYGTRTSTKTYPASSYVNCQ